MVKFEIFLYPQTTTKYTYHTSEKLRDKFGQLPIVITCLTHPIPNDTMIHV